MLLLAVVYNQEETDAHFCLARLYGEEAFFSIEYGLFHWCTFLKKFPNHTEGNMIVGDLYCKNDQPSLGRPYLEKHIHINPNSSKAYTLLGEIELLEKNFKVAKGYLLQALKIDNDYLPLYYPLITAYSLLENPIKCKAVLRLYLEKNPKDFVAYKMLGDIYLKLGELKKAKKSFKKALKLNPEEIQTYFKLGKVYERLGDLRKSNSILKKHTLWKEMRELHDGLLSTMGQNSRDSP